MLKYFFTKQIGLTDFSNTDVHSEYLKSVSDQIKIIFIPKEASIQVDFQKIKFLTDALLFINPNVVINPCKIISGQLLHFNRDFYCVEIHDHEVACDGVLYNNVFEIPFINLNEDQSYDIRKIIGEINSELINDDSNSEEMLRTLLKMIILKSTRIWKQQHHFTEQDQKTEVHFLRKFSKLVELHYKTLHTVADYADLLYITPKNLSKKIGLISKESPNEIIKNRIILESKRLLAHTNMTVKEVAYALNYEDDAYFIRFFTKNTGISPLSFRRQF